MSADIPGSFRRLAWAAGLALASATQALAQVGGCAPLAPLALGIVSQPPQVTVEEGHSRMMLSAMAENVLGHGMRPGFQLNGLTNTAFKWSAEMSYATAPEGDGSWCVSLASLDITLEYDDPLRVYIAKEIPRGSCQHKVTYAHEMRHVRFVFETLAKHLPGMRANLPDALRPYVTVRAETREEAVEHIRAFVRAVAERAFDVIRAETKALHASIDTDESYDAEGRLCR